MKITINDKIYVQKNDIAFLNQTDLPIPASIYLKVFNTSELIIIDDNNRFEFVEFKEQNEIEFFKKIDWIIDYNYVKDLNKSQILEIGQSIAQQKNKIAKKYNNMTKEERKENQQMVIECQKLDFKMYSLRDILWFKQGHIQFELPEGIDYPKDYKKTEEKGFKKILSKFKNKQK